MPRTRSLAWSELKIGIAGLVALVLLILIVVGVGGEGGYFWQRYPLRARFDNVQGLKAGAVVRLSGKEIGTVTDVEFSGPQVEVRFEVLDAVKPAHHDGVDSRRSAPSACSANPSWTSRAASGGTPLERQRVRQGGSRAGVLQRSRRPRPRRGLARSGQAAGRRPRRARARSASWSPTTRCTREMQAFVASAAGVTRVARGRAGHAGRPAEGSGGLQCAQGVAREPPGDDGAHQQRPGRARPARERRGHGQVACRHA